MLRLRLVQLAALLGAAVLAHGQVDLQASDVSAADGTTDFSILQGSLMGIQVSAEAEVRIENVINSLGTSNLTTPTLQYNPNPPQQGPPVSVNTTLSAPWHAIARPNETSCAVSSPHR